MKNLISGLFHLVVVFMLIGGLFWTASAVEAKTFNRVTGSDVTPFEAMWLNLRVDCSTTR